MYDQEFGEQALDMLTCHGRKLLADEIVECLVYGRLAQEEREYASCLAQHVLVLEHRMSGLHEYELRSVRSYLYVVTQRLQEVRHFRA